LFNKLIEYIFPRVCPVCGDLLTTDEGLIHEECMDKLNFVTGPTCARCGKQVISNNQRLCYDCAHHERHFVKGFTTLNYDETARNITSGLKYHNQRKYAAFLGTLMAYNNKEEIEGAHIDCIIPVPISKSRWRERRYNQAALIAQTIGNLLGIEVVEDGLLRSKKTKALKDLGAEDRLAELKNAIIIGNIPPDTKRVLIVDDIYTTGATMEACAYILWSQGIESYAACACIGSDF